MKLLRKTDLLLIIVLALIPVLFMIFNMYGALHADNPELVVYVDGEEYGRYLLNEDRTIDIGGTNVCRIEGGRAWMTEANCPDQICVHSAAIDEKGGNIVCLPNKIILTIENNEEGSASEDALDGVAG